jgi:dipeptidyl aminopeptidase/acylaminoacyl peptidase
MSRKTMRRAVILWLPLTLAVVLTAAAAAPSTGADPAGEVMATPGSIIAHHVPPIPRSEAEDLAPYENMRSAVFADWDPAAAGSGRMLVLTRFAQAAQLHEVAMPLGARRQLTFFGEPVDGGAYRPGHPDQIALSINQGGAENFQLLLLDRHTGRARRFSDGVHRYESPLWSHSGRWIAYVSNARNGRDFDLYTADPGQPGSERRIAELRGEWTPLDWTRDDSRLLMGQYISAAESYLWSVDLASGRLTALTPHRSGPAVAYQGGRWAANGVSVYSASNREGEFLRLVRLDPAARGAHPASPPNPTPPTPAASPAPADAMASAAVQDSTETVISVSIPWDVEGFDLSSDASVLAFLADEDGISHLHLLDTRSGRTLPSPELPPGAAGTPHFRPGTHELALAISWAHSPSDIYSYDADTRRFERWTESETGGLDADRFAVPTLIHYPTFDTLPNGTRRVIPAFVYRPDAGRFPGHRPVMISVHGGPEAQARPGFQGSTNYLIDQLGVAIVVPNVRGSAGYGKGYLELDNAEKREDSVKDLGALLDWIATQPDLDPARVMVAGGSYGGYMTLAALTHYSSRLACGFDTVGISNFVTFLEHTQEYRRDLRRVEYGDERDPKMRAFLESIAPVRHAGDIRKPLLVAAGANDPRVPVTESDQIAAAVEANGIPVWYVVAKDEGHGYQKKDNADYLRTVSIAFIKAYLLGAPAGDGGRPGGR